MFLRRGAPGFARDTNKITINFKTCLNYSKGKTARKPVVYMDMYVGSIYKSTRTRSVAVGPLCYAEIEKTI